MVAVTEMGKKKVGSSSGKLHQPVKVPPEFKMKLQIVAAREGVDMGDLIVRQMEGWLSREYTLALGRMMEEEKTRRG